MKSLNDFDKNGVTDVFIRASIERIKKDWDVSFEDSEKCFSLPPRIIYEVLERLYLSGEDLPPALEEWWEAEVDKVIYENI